MPPSPLIVVPTLPVPLAAMVHEAARQDAGGPVSDALAACCTIWSVAPLAGDADGSIVPFALGERDMADELARAADRLYGREREIGALLGAFERGGVEWCRRAAARDGPPGCR